MYKMLLTTFLLVFLLLLAACRETNPLPETYFSQAQRESLAGRPFSAILHLQKTIESIDGSQQKDYLLKSQVLAILALEYHNMAFDHQALHYAKESVDCARKTKDTLCLMKSLEQLSLFYLAMHQYENELNCETEALMLAKATSNVTQQRKIEINMASTLCALRRYDEASQYLHSLVLTDKNHHNSQLTNIQKAIWKHKNNIDSVEYYSRILACDSNINYKKDAYRDLTSISILRKNYAEAKHFFDEFTSLVDSTSTTNRALFERSQQSFMEFHNMEKRNMQLQSEREKNRLYLILAIVTTLLVLLSLIYFVIDNRRKQRINNYLNQQLVREQQRLLSQTLKSEITKTARERSLLAIKDTDIYRKMVRAAAEECRISESDWAQLDTLINTEFEGFSDKLRTLLSLSEKNYRVCVLSKIQLDPSQMAVILHSSRSAISQIRSRLYQRIFHKKGSTADFDLFIQSL